MAETVPRLRRARRDKAASGSETIATHDRRATRGVAFVISFLALTVFLWPVTRTWYLGDDAYTAFYADAVALRGISVIDLIVQEIRRAAEQVGRFAPLGAFVVFPAYLLTPSVFAFKLGVVFLTLLSVVIAVVLLRQLGFPWPYAVLFPASFCAVLQLRYWHDPVLAYAAAMQAVACLTLGALAALVAALRRRSVPLYALAVAFFAAGLLYWEGTVFLTPLVLPVVLLFGDRSLRGVVRRTAPFAALGAAYIVFVLALRVAAPEQGAEVDLYRPSLSFGGIASAVAKQVSGALPLSYLTAVAREPDPEGIDFSRNSSSPYGAAQGSQDVPPGFVASEWTLILETLGEPRTILLLAMLSLALAVALPRAARTPVSTRAIVAGSAIGVGLIVGSALGPALSTRWQAETFFGVPYISVFLAYLGVGMVLVSLLAAGFRAARASRGASTAVAVVFAAAIACGMVATNALNQRVIEAFEGVKRAMVFNERAIDAGLLRAADGSKELLLDQSVPLGPDFVSVADGRPVPPTVGLGEVDQFLAGCDSAPETCPRLTAPVAYLSRLDDRGMPWSAVCRVDVKVTFRVDGAACRGSIALAVGGETFPGQRCGQLVVDASYVPGARAGAELPLRPLPISTFDDVRFCLAEFEAPVFARSIVVAARRTAAAGPLQIVATYPAEIRAGERFNVQANGDSAMAIDAIGATPTTRVVMNGFDVPTQYVNPRLVTCAVPDRLFARPGRVEIRLRDRGVESAPAYLHVRP